MDYYSFACPASAPFFGYFGAAAAMALANLGAAYGTAKSGAGISGMGVSRPDLVMKALIPVVMAGVVGIYGLIIAVIISTKGKNFNLRTFSFPFPIVRVLLHLQFRFLSTVRVHLIVACPPFPK